VTFFPDNPLGSKVMGNDPAKTCQTKRKQPVSQSRVVRANGRAFRLSVEDDSLGQLLVAQQDRERLEKDGLRLARKQRQAEFQPLDTAMNLFLAGLTPLYGRLMANYGYHYVRGTWVPGRLTARQHLRLEFRAMQTPADLDRVTDLARSAREAWIALAAGDNPEVARGLEQEYATHRAKWIGPNDPPALGLLAEAIVLLWLQSTYHDLRYAHALHHKGTTEEVRFHGERTVSLREQMSKLQRDLENGRLRQSRREIEVLKIEALRQAVERRKRKRSTKENHL